MEDNERQMTIEEAEVFIKMYMYCKDKAPDIVDRTIRIGRLLHELEKEKT